MLYDYAETQSRIAKLFGAPGVYREGHYVLSSGLHSNVYFNKRAISDDPVLLQESGNLLANIIQVYDPAFLISPEAGALPFGQAAAEELTRRLGHLVEMLPARKDGKGGFYLDEGHLRWLDAKRIVVVEDVFTTGESTVKTLRPIYNDGHLVLAVVGLLDRSNGVAQEAIGDLPFAALKTVSARNWTFEECQADGPCSQGELICTEQKVGHGDTFVKEHGQPPYK